MRPELRRTLEGLALLVLVAGLMALALLAPGSGL